MFRKIYNRILFNLVDILCDLNENEIKSHIEDGTLGKWLEVWKDALIGDIKKSILETQNEDTEKM